jgi:hypothetical protein
VVLIWACAQVDHHREHPQHQTEPGRQRIPQRPSGLGPHPSPAIAHRQPRLWPHTPTGTPPARPAPTVPDVKPGHCQPHVADVPHAAPLSPAPAAPMAAATTGPRTRIARSSEPPEKLQRRPGAVGVVEVARTIGSSSATSSRSTTSRSVLSSCCVVNWCAARYTLRLLSGAGVAELPAVVVLRANLGSAAAGISVRPRDGDG